MIRLVARLVLNILANAVGLIVASAMLDSFSIHGVAFVFAVLVFSLTTTVLGPLVTSIAIKNASFLIGGTALVTSFVGLFITNIFSHGISMTGLSAWILAPVIIWLFSLVANLFLPLVIFKKTLAVRKNSKED